ncbi:tail fiber domain-containing protein [Candidatus Latescibacterota bacterium]
MNKFILLFPVFFLVSQLCFAQIPQTMSYQGVLNNTDGTTVADGEYTITVKMYDVLTGGSPLWTEVQSITTSSGIFNVILGSVNPLNISFDNQYYLGITVGSEELTPRMKLTSSPYSLNAQSLSGSSNIIPSDGEVGIGTTSPDTILEVSESHDPSTGTTTLKISNPSGAYWEAGESATGIEFEKEDQVTGYIRSMHTRAGGDHSFEDAGLVFGTAPSADPTEAEDRMVIDSNGKVGIGTMEPSEELEVSGTVKATTFVGDGSGLTGVGVGGGGLWTDTNGDIYRENGNVGIGTVSPTEKLEVSGTVKATAFVGDGTGITGITTTETDPTVLASVKDGVSWSEIGSIPSDFADGTDDVGLVSGVASIDDLSDGSTGGGDRNLFLGSSSGAAIESQGINNTGLGFETLKALTTGQNNTASGTMALYSNTIGSHNTAFGVSALRHNIGGDANTACGYTALLLNTEGNHNTAIGYAALYYNTTGSFNTASGQSALNDNTTGQNNTANGFSALQQNTEGNNNTASGSEALIINTFGDNNTASGFQALRNNTEGDGNTATGFTALRSNTTGLDNTATGAGALYYNTTGQNNTANGYGALKNNTTANGNTAYGYASLLYNTTGRFNTASGFGALRYSTEGSNNTAIGKEAGNVITTGQNNVLIGTDSDPSVNVAVNQIVIGYDANGIGDNYAVIGNSDIERLYVAQDGAGVLYANGTIQSSDKRIKENIDDIDYGLTFINKLRPVMYNDKKPEDYPVELKEKFYPNEKVREMSDEEHERMRTGLIAQEVLSAIQEMNLNSDLVTVDDDGFHRLDYTKMVVPLIKAVQELSARVEKLEAQLNEREKIDVAYRN